MHTRRMVFEAFAREDGLWDIEAHLVDTKPFPVPLESGVRPADEPVHDHWLRLTIDEAFNVIEAEAAMDRQPYVGSCDRILPDYGKLAGLNLLSSFRRRSIELLGGAHGCTHLTEMLGQFPTAAIQSLFRKPREDDGVKPFQLDRCHALVTDGDTVQRYYPRWYVGHGKKNERSPVGAPPTNHDSPGR